jgi:hypothetical protein
MPGSRKCTVRDVPAAVRSKHSWESSLRDISYSNEQENRPRKKRNAPYELCQRIKQLHHTCNKAIRNTFNPPARKSHRQLRLYTKPVSSPIVRSSFWLKVRRDNSTFQEWHNTGMQSSMENVSLELKREIHAATWKALNKVVPASTPKGGKPKSACVTLLHNPVKQVVL